MLFKIAPDVIEACEWIGDRYGWGSLIGYLVDDELYSDPNQLKLSESDAWALKEAIDEDDGRYPCAGTAVIAAIEAIFNHYDI